MKGWEEGYTEVHPFMAVVWLRGLTVALKESAGPVVLMVFQESLPREELAVSISLQLLLFA